LLFLRLKDFLSVKCATF